MELDTLNLTQICRTCKCMTPQMQSLFEAYENAVNAHQSPRIDEMLMTCTSVQVMCDDGLPAQICGICLEQLKNAFIFKRQVERIDADLREYIKNVKVNEIKQEPQNSDLMEPLNPLSNLPNEQAKESNQEPCDSPVIPKIETDDVQSQDNDEMLLTCYECSKSFSTLKGLRWHKRIHISILHKCSKCDKQYTILNHLRRHEELHTRKKVHVCKICNKTVARTEHLKRHLLTHLKAIPFSCNSCNRVFSKVGHLRNHTSKCKRDVVFPCDTCNKVFNRQDSLEVHKKMHDKQPKLLTIENLNNIEDYYRIDDCLEPQVEVTENTDEDKVKELVDMGLNDEESDKIKELVDTGTNDKESDINETSMAGGNDNEDISNMEKASKCLENENDDSKVKVEDNLEMKDSLEDKDKIINIPCDAEENSRDTMDPEYLPKKKVSQKLKPSQGRLRKYPTNPSKIKVPGKRKSPPTISKVQKEEEYKEFPCPACQEIFNTMSALAKHAKIQHEGLKVYKCNECNKEFRRVNHLNTHVISHSAAKPFRCHVCSKSFNRRDTLNRHQKLHDTSNEVECDICQKAFSRSDLLVNHRAAKHGCVSGQKEQKEYQCKVCQKTFLLKSLFNRHLKFHNEHAKKFLCSECGQRFLKKDYFIIHMRRHRGEKPFQCKYCGKGFPRTTDLRVHERYHTGEKTHLCTICGRGFGRGYDLKVHMRTHTGEKPYRCKFCDAAFVQCNDLKAHVRRHTGERFHCELCSENFLKEYLLTQHKRTVHSLDVVGNVRRLQPVQKQENPDEPTNNTSA